MKQPAVGSDGVTYTTGLTGDEIQYLMYERARPALTAAGVAIADTNYYHSNDKYNTEWPSKWEGGMRMNTYLGWAMDWPGAASFDNMCALIMIYDKVVKDYATNNGGAVMTTEQLTPPLLRRNLNVGNLGTAMEAFAPTYA